MVDDQRRKRLDVALRDRDDELRELRQTLESNERALLRSLDDERRRWDAERRQIQAELMSARRSGLPGSRSAAFGFPSVEGASSTSDRSQIGAAAVVIVEPSLRLPAAPASRGCGDKVASGWSTDFSAADVPCAVGNRDKMASPESSLPVEIASRSASSAADIKGDFETGRWSAAADAEDVGSARELTEKLQLELELCRKEFADERRRWVDEKRLVVEYQLRLQAHCRQLAERNQLLEQRLRATSSELALAQNGGSSGYGSDSPAFVLRYLDDGRLLTSTL